MILVTAREMAELDRRTIEEIGMPGVVLMENAARGALAFFERILPDLTQRRVVVLAGTATMRATGSSSRAFCTTAALRYASSACGRRNGFEAMP